MKEYKYRVIYHGNKASLIYTIAEGVEITHDLLQALNEADGNMLLDDYYKDVVGSGKVTKTDVGKIEQFRTLFNEGSVKLVRDY